MNAIVPISKVELTIRPATMADVPFMDALQKKYGKALGYFPLKQFEEYVEAGHVLIAEEGTEARRHEGTEGADATAAPPCSSLRAFVPPCLRASPLGYLISKDRYLKRDELGVIYQLCVTPGAQRGLVGATLVKTAFERSAYGCRLYCCWCAQDLEANRFWESLGFVPLAFRAGSDKKRRVHIFWQKRICEGDESTPWWYPFQTSGGAIRADRVVLPIPPGVHWSEVKAVEMPGERHEGTKALRHEGRKGRRSSSPFVPACLRASVPPPGKVGILVGGRIKYVDRPANAGTTAPPPAGALPVPLTHAGETPAPRKRVRREAAKVDPKFLAAARELRDRYLEHVNEGAGAAALDGAGKYHVTRRLPTSGGPAALPSSPPLLTAA